MRGWLWLVSLCACASVHRSLDEAALDSKVRLVLTLPPTPAKRPLPFSDAPTLAAVTSPSPVEPSIEPLTARRLERDGLIQERWTFPSTPPVKHEASNRAVLYVYRAGELGERPVVVMVPGFAVNDGAFGLLSRMLVTIVDQGADAVFVVPPYHLDRTPPGTASGDALLATDATDHFTALAQGVADVRRTLQLVRSRQPPTVGAIAASMGAASLLRAMSWDGGVDFATLITPVVSWEDMVFETPLMEPVRQQLRNAGVPDDEARAMYRALDASWAPPASRVRLSIFAARYDQVARTGPLDRLVDHWRVPEPRWIERGHADALFTPSLYKAYARTLEDDLAAKGHRSR